MQLGILVVFLEEKKVFLFYINEGQYFEKNYTPSEWFEIEYESEYNLSQVFVVPWGKLYRARLFIQLTLR